MTKAGTDISVDRGIDRGRRMPEHKGLIAQQPERFFRPFCVAPVRPGETLLMADVQGDTLLDSIVQYNNLPMTYAEMGLWFVPFSRMPDWMRQIIIGTGFGYLNLADIQGTTAAVAPGANAADIQTQGHQTPGLQSRVRPWAGEIGGNQTTQQSESVYAPYASHATYAIAEDWYDSDRLDWDQEDLMQNEPVLSPHSRGATRTNFDVGLAGLDPDPSSVTSLADLIEQLFLMTTAEMSWPEYLASHGVDPRNAHHMTHPLMIRHGYVGPMGPGHIVTNGNSAGAGDVDIQDDSFSSTRQRENYTNDINHDWDARICGSVGQRWNGSVRPNLRFDQPGFIVGTVTWWQETGQVSEYGHLFDATRMTHPGHWGVRQAGGVEEEDFLATQDLYDAAGTAIVNGASSGQTGTGSSVFNLLNLFLHGEVTAPLGGDFFRYRGPMGRLLPEGLVRMSSRFNVRLDIRSDLVGG